ncbi:hypothetical protein BU24DRAFT_176843 [Aaosphaeria arxii CBS 175.79]|uniref:PD-(D/E)XK nuclease-like domain-containing protein n=1 Tax=Aaosphaeria arxii CBS 175.79 TaxID=1450172 RepID=A0A6A5XRC4_9PLEO|nr:uncharacterized protein BU24DRAFT_176843 [Aaosphaeria arxii CBS 175.79]KAF2015387.1 hypothetical protein BU24DRAFT_176843 [Aaosphaeria arxii CBS 175.79]
MAGAGFKTSNMGTSSCDFDHGDTRTEEELSDMWQKVKTIYENASDCKLHTGDENAWSDDVVRPLLQLAIEIHGGDRWKLHNVKSQSIDPQYLSTIDAPTPANASRTRVVDRRADYALAYSHRSPRYSDLYVRLKAAKQSEVGPTLAQWTRQSAVFSGFEVKSPLGTQHEAEQQISIWIAASLRKKQELASIARVPPFQRADMVEPVFTIVGHHHFVYFAWPRKHPVSCEWGTQVLGPHSRLTFNTLDLHGVFQLLRFYGEVLKYAADEGPNGYWGRFFGKVLNQLAASRPDNN